VSLVVGDVVCQAPSVLVEGLDTYRQFLAPFARDFRGMEDLTAHD
jgi:hypothetical protein